MEFCNESDCKQILKKHGEYIYKMYTYIPGEKIKGLERVGKRYERRDSFKFTHGDVLGSVSALANTSSYRQD